MSKPLELNVYPVCDCDKTDEPHYAGKSGWTQWFADDRAYMKRLTDAELAAEYWAPIWLTMPDAKWEADYEGTCAEMKHRMAILYRFATLPHYTEAD